MNSFHSGIPFPTFFKRTSVHCARLIVRNFSSALNGLIKIFSKLLEWFFFVKWPFLNSGITQKMWNSNERKNQWSTLTLILYKHTHIHTNHTEIGAKKKQKQKAIRIGKRLLNWRKPRKSHFCLWTSATVTTENVAEMKKTESMGFSNLVHALFFALDGPEKKLYGKELRKVFWQYVCVYKKSRYFAPHVFQCILIIQK